MTHNEIRQKFLKFFEKRNHKVVPSSSLLPDDPSVLFTTAGMQQFKRYYTGELNAEGDFGSLNAASIQKCIRTSDIDEVGDESHLTFFEMLGNFSFGGYFKEEAIKFGYEFIVKELGLKIDYVSVFGGDDGIPADNDSEKIWQSLDPGITVKKFGRADNFWGPTGDEGPCGPTTEIYVDGIEIWNIVFNQYYQRKDPAESNSADHHSEKGRASNGASKTLEPLKTPGIDTGMGLERLTKVSQKTATVFETDLFAPIVRLLSSEMGEKIRRIITDHSRAIAFLISDGIHPSNKDRGYVLRRLMRRVITYGQSSGFDLTLMHDIFAKIHEIYVPFYSALNRDLVINEFDHEKEKFEKTLKNGLKELQHIQIVDAPAAFKLYESYGLPYEIIKELGQEKAAGLNRENFDVEFKKHQEKSRAGAEKKFGGHGLMLDTGELKAADEAELKRATRLHTATHMLQAALRRVLGDEVAQAGSDITAERLRFDFTFPRRLTPEETRQVEGIVNEAIQKDMPVTKEEMPLEEAKKTGALFFFKEKYPEKVNVYSVGDFSKELCGGPHVLRSGEVGKFKITKEEAVSAGVRRIRATVD